MWYLVAVFSGFSFASADALSKKEAVYSPAIILAWVREAYALPFLLPVLFLIEIPPLDKIFWIAVSLCVILDLITTFLYMQAIRIAPLSLTIPYMGLTPIFSLGISMVVLGESVTLPGLVGILLVSCGAYILQIDLARYGIWEPLLAIFKNRGSRYMFIVAFAYAFTANIGKLAIQHSSPLFMTNIYFLLLAIAYIPLVLIHTKGQIKPMVIHGHGKLAVGFAMALMAITHFTAISHINVAYMISIKRLSLVFAILYGWLWFKETKIKERFLGGIIMVIGAACIAFS